MMIVSREGRILYVSESIANYLGLRQVNIAMVDSHITVYYNLEKEVKVVKSHSTNLC